MKRTTFLLCLGVFGILPSFAASMNQMDHGPFVSWTIRGEGESVTYKGIAIKLDSPAQAAVCFDTDLLRYSAAWTGGFLQWYPERDGLERNPTIDGKIWFDNAAGPGWSINDSLKDPREIPYGPLPKKQAHFSGLYRTGSETILSYTVGDRQILDSPQFETIQGEGYFIRHMLIGAGKSAPLLRVTRMRGQFKKINGTNTENGFGAVRIRSETQNRLIGFKGLPVNAEWKIQDQHLCLKLPASESPLQIALLLGNEPKGHFNTHQDQLKKHIETNFEVKDLTQQRQTTATLWDETLKTPIRKGNDRDALAVDTLTLPRTNPWKSWIRFGGLDFLSQDRAILGSISGDVWLVSGLGEGSTTLNWKRFATGLYQPLGVKVVDGKIYVLGRDQITRLHDLDGDDEADFYENFNNDSMVAENFHSFTLNLETDSEGNFFYAQGAPWPPTVRTPHQGMLFKVSPDGKTFESFADGLRGPNGMAIGPNNMITYSDNEGHWLPTCSLQLIRPGGFHGMKPTAHLHDSVPVNFEQPICWIPHAIDNSPGDQIWIDSESWGPLNGKMLMTSYGKSSLSLVMMQDVKGSIQGGTLKLPIKFRSGIIRGRQNKLDDHLYLCGLSVWQTTGVEPAGFYRVRYTGRPLNIPLKLTANKDSIDLTFSDPINRQLATDPDSYNLEQWNYRWIDRYGSPHYSVSNPNEEGQDIVKINTVELSPDGKTVSIKVDKVVPVMQMKIAYNLETEGGQRMRNEIHNTIHAIP
ncbi:MAG: hypothetical protein HOI66_21665 [Verrucomicrobia bacterium]|nr:hypothetical protein [Verrucomicrobiota bacterium]